MRVSLLERILTHPAMWGLPATNVQRAACRVLDGVPLDELWDDPDVPKALGGVRPPEVMPLEFLLLAAIRSGKGVIASACAFRASQTCDVSKLRPGETPRISVISTEKDKATIVFNHLLGTMTARPSLRDLLVGEPTGDALYIRHPTGIPVEVLVTAGKRAGGAVIGRWMAGVIFDEAARMYGADDGVVNLDDTRRAALGRMLPGAQILYITSPHAPFGPVYDWTQEHFAKPSKRIVVMRATGPMMNPVLWTPEACEELRQHDHIAYKTDVLGEFADAEYAAFQDDEIAAVTRASAHPVPFVKGQHYVAAMDPATRSNAWTLVVWTCTGADDHLQPKYEAVFARQWVPRAEKLRPLDVLCEVADELEPYGLDTAFTDQWSADALADVASMLPDRAQGCPRTLTLIDEATNAQNKYDGIKTLQVLIQSGRLSLPPDPMLRQDLLGTKQRVTQIGVTFQLPRTKDGRHGDFVPPLARLALNPPDLPLAVEVSRDPDLDAARARIAKQNGEAWWEGTIARATGARN